MIYRLGFPAELCIEERNLNFKQEVCAPRPGGRLLLFHQDWEQRGQFFSQLLGGGDRSAVFISAYAIKYAVIRE